MDAEQLLGSLIRGALGARRKRSRRALRYLAGGRGSLLNTGTLLAAAGLAWGLYETATRATSTGGVVAGSGATPPPAAPPATPPAVPPLPAGLPVPPAETTAGRATDAPAMTPEVLRVIRLTVSAARADGTLAPNEQAAILEHARSAGAEALVQQELQRPTPLAELLAGVDPARRDDLYTLAFAIVRADEDVSGAERIYLAQLAHQLGLDPSASAALEARAVERIMGN